MAYALNSITQQQLIRITRISLYGILKLDSQMTLSREIERVHNEIDLFCPVTPLFGRLQKVGLKFLTSSFVIRVNLLHPCFFMIYYYLFGVFLS